MASAIPSVKIERVPSPDIKAEADDDTPEPMEEDDIYEDPGDLDFSNAHQKIWLGHIPKSLWDIWASLGEDEEIEIGTIRLEGSEANPSRVLRTFCACVWRG